MDIIIGKKVGMTQVLNPETGAAVAVTVVDVSENVVAKVQKIAEKNYVQLGKSKKKHPNKADLGNFAKIKYVPAYSFSTQVEGELPEEGADVKADIFAEGDVVEIKGVSKGKGFSGVMKRHNFKGGKETHGQSDRHRAPGSIGAGTTPGRVLKGKKMAGRMGRENMTIKNSRIMFVDAANSLIAVKGAVPGHRGSYIVIKKSAVQK